MKTINLKGIKELAKAARDGKLTTEEINHLVANVEHTLHKARRAHIVSKRDPKKVAAAVKKAKATRERNRKEAAKWAKITEKKHKAKEARLAAGYLHEELSECGAGVPNPEFYEYSYTDERSGGYKIYRLREEYRNRPVPGANVWVRNNSNFF
jgi:hypothetical protein